MNEDMIRHDELLDNLTDGVYFTDRDRKILYWNKGAEIISGYSRSEVVGSHCWDNILVHIDCNGNSLCRGACPLMKSIRTCQNCVTEAFLKHKDGHRVPVLIKTIPMIGKDGNATGAVEVFADNSHNMEMREKVKELEKLALVDALTGLGNRRYIETTIRIKMEGSLRYGWGVGLSFIDIDNFKKVNDLHGHDAGDTILKLLARNLASNSRILDIPGRWGGEEFVVVSENTDENGLMLIAERYRILMQNSNIHVKGRDVAATISIGATMMKPEDTPESFVARSDKLMYSSKQNGRNRVTIG
jgi:diguanylate cyclase (GGDEF)-like protein/PAS domain S-box-containing protein